MGEERCVGGVIISNGFYETESKGVKGTKNNLNVLETKCSRNRAWWRRINIIRNAVERIERGWHEYIGLLEWYVSSVMTTNFV